MIMKGKRRHDFIYRTLWMLLRHSLARKFNFIYDSIKVEQSPYIVISNHLTNWDPILIGLSFGRNMYYVATDQILRMGLKSKLLNFCFAPIPRAKTVNETQTVISIFKHLKENCNICIFAEGNSSFDGENSEVQPSIGKLIKRVGVTLVTYRFTGAYFTFPRWARFNRKGKMEGRLVNIYGPEKIASMSEDEIYKTIVNDITVSAYTDQEKNMIPYYGKKPAEYLETALYCCPKCKKFASLTSRDDILSCTCSFKVRYNEYCYFEIPATDEQPPFKTITDWVNWQKKEIESIAGTIDKFENHVPIFTDENQKLFEVKKASSNTFLLSGKLCFYKNRLSIEASSGTTFSFPLDSIIEMSGFAMTRIIFSTNDKKLYEIHSKHPRSALKYIDIFNAIKYNKNKE